MIDIASPSRRRAAQSGPPDRIAHKKHSRPLGGESIHSRGTTPISRQAPIDEPVAPSRDPTRSLCVLTGHNPGGAYCTARH